VLRYDVRNFTVMFVCYRRYWKAGTTAIMKL